MTLRTDNLWAALRGGAKHFTGNHGMVFSASVAFNLLLSSIPILFLSFAAILVPPMWKGFSQLQWRNALHGTALFLFLLYGIRRGFTFYVWKFSRLNLINGSLFSIVCFIIVAYLFAAAYLFCACIIGVLERNESGGKPPGEDSGAADA